MTFSMSFDRFPHDLSGEVADSKYKFFVFRASATFTSSQWCLVQCLIVYGGKFAYNLPVYSNTLSP